MKRFLLVFMFVFLISTPAFATYFFDGSELVKQWHEYQKIENIQDGDFIQRGQFIGFVFGVADSNDGVRFTIPANVTKVYLLSSVGKYIDANPLQWNIPAKDLVMNALMSAFPKK